MTSKVCTKCGEEKPFGEFSRAARKKDGLQSNCKRCVSDYMKAYYERDKERCKQRAKNWVQENPERRTELRKRHYADNRQKYIDNVSKWVNENKERANCTKRKWERNNPDQMRAKDAKRRAAKLQRSCLLRPGDEAKIKAMYGFAEYLTKKFGEPWHVDHIVPLQGKTISGLHVPGNLCVLHASRNLSKSNKIDYELVPHAFRPGETF